MDTPEFQNGIRVLGGFDKTYDILIKPPQLMEAITLVNTFPNQKFVLDHIAKPRISKGLDSKWASEIKELAQHPNLYCKVSGMVTETDEFKWTKGDFTEFLQLITDAFGTDRIMFGSDWPVCLLAASYNEVHSIITDFYSASEVDKVMGENAVRFYNL
jgi:L-fuconolactonase